MHANGGFVSMATRKNSSTGRKTKKERMQEMERAEALRREIILWGVVAVSLLLFISNIGVGGAVGGAVSGFIFGLFGMVAYVFPVLLLVGSFFAISNRGNSIAILKLISAIIFAVFICVFLSLAVSFFVATFFLLVVSFLLLYLLFLL